VSELRLDGEQLSTPINFAPYHSSAVDYFDFSDGMSPVSEETAGAGGTTATTLEGVGVAGGDSLHVETTLGEYDDISGGVIRYRCRNVGSSSFTIQTPAYFIGRSIGIGEANLANPGSNYRYAISGSGLYRFAGARKWMAYRFGEGIPTISAVDDARGMSFALLPQFSSVGAERAMTAPRDGSVSRLRMFAEAVTLAPDDVVEFTMAVAGSTGVANPVDTNARIISTIAARLGGDGPDAPPSEFEQLIALNLDLARAIDEATSNDFTSHTLGQEAVIRQYHDDLRGLAARPGISVEELVPNVERAIDVQYLMAELAYAHAPDSRAAVEPLYRDGAYSLAEYAMLRDLFRLAINSFISLIVGYFDEYTSVFELEGDGTLASSISEVENLEVRSSLLSATSLYGALDGAVADRIDSDVLDRGAKAFELLGSAGSLADLLEMLATELIDPYVDDITAFALPYFLALEQVSFFEFQRSSVVEQRDVALRKNADGAISPAYSLQSKSIVDDATFDMTATFDAVEENFDVSDAIDIAQDIFAEAYGGGTPKSPYVFAAELGIEVGDLLGKTMLVDNTSRLTWRRMKAIHELPEGA
jgi:hypothetical protein